MLAKAHCNIHDYWGEFITASDYKIPKIHLTEKVKEM